MKAKPDRRLAIAVLLALLGLGGALWWSFLPRPSAQNPEQAVTPRSPAVGAASEPAASDQSVEPSSPVPAAAAPPTAPLPKAELPLAQTIDELSARATAGDSRAACRLAADLGLCARLASIYASQLSDVKLIDFIAHSDADEAQREAMLQQHLELQGVHSHAQTFCRDISAEQIGRLPHYQWQAANAGHLQSAYDFLNGGGRLLSPQALIADPSLARLYQQNALALLRRLLDRGEPVGAWAWSIANQNTETPLGPLLPFDMRNARVSSALIQRIAIYSSDRRAFTDAELELSAAERQTLERYYRPFHHADASRRWAEHVSRGVTAGSLPTAKQRQQALTECEAAAP